MNTKQQIVFLSDITGNIDKCYLGKLCKNGHDLEGTGKSLRLNSDSEVCIWCCVKNEWNQWKKEYYEKKREDKRKDNLQSTLRGCMGTAIRNSLKLKKLSKDDRVWEKRVGYSTEDLKKHLESQFTEGMSWDNFEDWHIDHIIPQNLFIYESFEDEQFKMCWCLENLRPLWGKDNVTRPINGSDLIGTEYEEKWRMVCEMNKNF